jgi:GNAT superfamily N-acetyltransferase
MKDFSLTRSDYDNKDFLDLTILLDKDLDYRYGEVQKQYNQFNKVINVDMVVIAYSGKIPAGCGSFKSYKDAIIEIKRMYVKPEFRGSGIAKLIYDELEKSAIQSGYTQAILETGKKQPEAIRFYTKLGYEIIDNYDQYIGMENSVCMSKKLNLYLL